MISLTTNAELQEALRLAGTTPANYKPAYSGSSVGLDLYNASPKGIVVQPLRPDPSMRDGATGGWLPHNNPVDQNQLARLVATGLRVNIPKGYAGLILDRGSVIRTPLRKRAGVIDPEYTGQVFVAVYNVGGQPYVIEPYARLPFQLVVVQCLTQFCHVDADVFEHQTSGARRKAACLGSSDAVPAPAEAQGEPVPAVDLELGVDVP